MRKLKWYFKHGATFEVYSVLYEDKEFILVKNDRTKKHSFGLKQDFGTLYGFPVSQSCLTTGETKETLQRFIDIDERYISEIPDIANQNIKRWQDMILRLIAE